MLKFNVCLQLYVMQLWNFWDAFQLCSNCLEHLFSDLQKWLSLLIMVRPRTRPQSRFFSCSVVITVNMTCCHLFCVGEGEIIVQQGALGGLYFLWKGEVLRWTYEYVVQCVLSTILVYATWSTSPTIAPKIKAKAIFCMWKMWGLGYSWYQTVIDKGSNQLCTWGRKIHFTTMT